MESPCMRPLSDPDLSCWRALLCQIYAGFPAVPEKTFIPQQLTPIFNMLFTFYLQNTTILLTINILYSKYHQKAYYLQM